MPKELAKPFLDQAKRTRKERYVWSFVGAVAIKFGAPMLMEAVRAM